MKTETEKPLYGTIPFCGNEWSVVFADHDNVTNQSLSGYGDFPFDRFCIPVIDFRNDEKVWDWLKANPQNIRPEDRVHFALKMGLKVI